jgi:hypothetical protein
MRGAAHQFDVHAQLVGLVGISSSRRGLSRPLMISAVPFSACGSKKLMLSS